MWVVHLCGGSWMDLRGSIIWPQWFGRDDIPPLYYLKSDILCYMHTSFVSHQPIHSHQWFDWHEIEFWMWKWISHDCPWLGSIREVFIGTRLSAVWAELRVTAPLGLKKQLDTKLQSCGFILSQQDHGKTSQNYSKPVMTMIIVMYSN